MPTDSPTTPILEHMTCPNCGASCHSVEDEDSLRITMRGTLICGNCDYEAYADDVAKHAVLMQRAADAAQWLASRLREWPQ